MKEDIKKDFFFFFKKEGCIYESDDILEKINNYDKIFGNNPNISTSYSQKFY